MEVITLGITPLGTNFTGPVMILTGEYDFIFCTGYCSGILVPGAEKTFPNSKDLQVYTQPDSGHGINLSVRADNYETEDHTDLTTVERYGLFWSNHGLLGEARLVTRTRRILEFQTRYVFVCGI
jgi:hypothetical protein